MSGIDANDPRDETIMPLLLSKSFGLVKAQDRKISHEFCEGVEKLLDNVKYDESIVIKTVDAILADIPEKDQSLKDAIMTELIECYPDIKWSFKNTFVPKSKSQLPPSELAELVI